MLITEMKLLCVSVEKRSNLAILTFEPTTIPHPPHSKPETGLAIDKIGIVKGRLVLAEPWPSHYVVGRSYHLNLVLDQEKPPPGPPK